MGASTPAARDDVIGFDRVVVGLDGSRSAHRALVWAAERLAPSGSLSVVNATTDGSEKPTIASLLAGPWSDPAREAGVERLRTVVHVDDPARALLACADDVGADAIVVGAHGSGGAGRRSPFLGSVTRKLLRRSLRPVVVHNEAPTGNLGPVIACVGYGRTADTATGWAASYAAGVGRPLVLLHAVSHRPVFPFDSPLDMLGSYLGAGVDVGWAEDDLTATATELLADEPDLEVTTSIVRGSAVRAILDAGRGDATTTGAELVVLGRQGGSAAELLPPSPRLYRIIAGAACPTAVVPACRTTDDR